MYNVWLLKSEEYALEKYWQVLNLLQGFPGPLRFYSTEDPVNYTDGEIDLLDYEEDIFKRQKEVNFLSEVNACYHSEPKIPIVSWSTLFNKAENFRKRRDLGNTEFVIVLTDLSNEYNWFIGGDPSGKKNMFVHTAFWEYFSGSDQRYPVAYHIVSGILKNLTFQNYNELQQHLHKQPKGCFADFCIDKQEVHLKLRTADICKDCLALMEARKVPKSVIVQTLQVFEGIRTQMLFKSRWPVTPELPKMHIIGRSKQIVFPELGNLEVGLTPLEKTIYLFYLNHPEGIKINELHDYNAELLSIYSALYTGSDLASVGSNIANLCSPLSNSASEKISKIKSKFNNALGKEMTENYCIIGENAEKKRIKIRLVERTTDELAIYG
jgi:hypothetical protein